MSVPPELLTAVRKWLTKAAHDLKNAEHTLTLPDPECPLDTVCFHAQQCAEKSIKAFLVFHQVQFEKTHELGELLELCAMDRDLIRELDSIDRLTPYASDARYPEGDVLEEIEEIDRRQAERAVALARKAHQAIRRRLEPKLVA